MRRGWKIFWIVCGMMVAIGLACCAVAWGMGVTTNMIHNRFPYGIGWVSNGDSGPVAGDIHESFTGVTEIDMELSAGKVIFKEGSGSDIQIDTKKLSKRLGFKCYMDGSELKLESRKRLNGLNSIGGGTITVTIPKDMAFEEVSLSMGAGSMEIEKIQARDLSVNVGAGEVVIDSFLADEADFECGAGSITARGEVTGEADLQCGVGSIEYTAFGQETEYNYDIECGIGEIVCGANSYSGLGRDQRIDNGAVREINIEGGVGSVIVNFDANASHHN